MQALLLVLPLFFSHPVEAASCSTDAKASIASAEALLAQVPATPAIDQAGLVERTRILLETVIAAEPKCKTAITLKAEADGMIEATTAASQAANLEQAIAEASRRVEDLELATTRNPESLEALRFFLSDLARIAPDDARIPALQTRAAALGGGR